MRLLVITRAPWLDDNGIGSTLTDFFSDFENSEIYGLCLREAPFVTPICKDNFYMSERQIIKTLIKKMDVVGEYTINCEGNNLYQKKEAELYNKAKRLNWTILQFAREILWGTDVWKNERLDRYLEEINPDIIFFPDFPCVYAHRVLKYLKIKTNAKVAIYHADDCYTLKQFSVSPIYWMFRFYQRKWVRSSVRISDIHYVISDVQKEDYDKAFGVEHKVLTKFGDFSGCVELKNLFNTPLQMVYTGNIGLNRWKSLAIIAEALKEINKQGTLAELRIYTSNKITDEIKKALDIPGSSIIMGQALACEIPKIQMDADMLVHVESFDLKNRLIVRQSFSTKIVDYFKRGRAILAVGPSEVASIKYLIDNECAIVGKNRKDIIDKIDTIIKDKNILNEYAQKAFQCGKNKHNKRDMLKMLHDDLSGRK